MTKEKTITVVTMSKGRDSIKRVAYDLQQQNVQPDVWFIAADGKEAYDKIKSHRLNLYYSGYINLVLIDPPVGKASYEIIFNRVEEIETDYVTFMDDDNSFSGKHIERLVEELNKGRRFVATARYYMDTDGVPIAVEHPNSEVLDTNCIGVTTDLFKIAASFYKQFWEDPDLLFNDRHLTCLFLACGVMWRRIPHCYTVLYRVNNNAVYTEKIKDSLVLEHMFNFTTQDAVKPQNEADRIKPA